MSWDDRFLSLCNLIAGWSKDRSRKVGAVIVDERNAVVSLGWNGFPRGIDDDVEERHERPAKYQWTEHAERNAIFNAASLGAKVGGCRMFLQWYPCADCARAVIQSGIAELVCFEPDWDDPKWGSDFRVVDVMLREADITIRYIGKHAVPAA